jgi:subtilisin family serine protease
MRPGHDASQPGPCRRLLAERKVKVLPSSVDDGRSLVVELLDPGRAEDSDARLQELAAELSAQPDVESVEANVLLAAIPPVASQAAVAPEEIAPSMWALDKMRIQEAWAKTRGSRGIKVAVLDDGIDYRNSALAPNMWINPCEDHPPLGVIDAADFDRNDDACPGASGNGLVDDLFGWDFVDDDAVPLPGSGDLHGTHVAGSIGAVLDPADGVGGVNQEVSMLALRVASQGSVRTDLIVRAIHYAIQADVDVINASWAISPTEIAPGLLPAPIEQKFPTIEAAFQAAEAAGIVVVAAAGNSGANSDWQSTIPASLDFDNIIAVAASDPNDELWELSNYGQISVDLAAPGVDIHSTAPCGEANEAPCGKSETFYGGGTSFAAPFVAGVAALVLARFPSATPQQVKERIKAGDCVTSLKGKLVSGARLNAALAVSDSPPPVPCSPLPSEQES